MSASEIQPLDKNWQYHLANISSYIINPLVISPIGIWIVLAHFGASQGEVFQLTLIAVIAFCVLPFAYLLYLVKQGDTTSVEVRLKEDRKKPLLFGMLMAVLGGIDMLLLGETAPSILISLVSAQTIATLLVMLITLFWKISLHLTGISGFVGAMYFIATQKWLLPTTDVIVLDWIYPLFALLVFMMWARVRVKAHTVAQVIGGALFGFFLTQFIFYVVNGCIFNVLG